MKYFYFFFMTLLFASCATANKQFTNNKTTNCQIRFGSGGGFTGAITEYCVLQNGNLFKHQNAKIDKLSAKKQDINKAFAQCEAIKFTDKQINQPGNMYSYIEYRMGEQIHRVTWNPKQSTLPSDLIEFNNLLLALVGEPILEQPKTMEEKVKEVPDNKKEVLSKVQPVKKKAANSSSIKDDKKSKKQNLLPKYKQ